MLAMKYLKIILKDYTLIKLCFGFLTGYLLYEEFYVFFIAKPTYTSSARQKIGL